jgi:hypothetical protein
MIGAPVPTEQFPSESPGREKPGLSLCSYASWFTQPLTFVMAQGGVANAEAALIGGIEGGLTYLNNAGGEIRGDWSPPPVQDCRV